MNCFFLTFISLLALVLVVHSAVVPGYYEIEQEGLYRKTDKVVILGLSNFDKYIYGQDHAWLVQFYSSNCGHCKAFAPKFKEFAANVYKWKKAVKLAVINCDSEDNVKICRDFEIMAYPTLRYFHENYVRSNSNFGERFDTADSADKLRVSLTNKLKEEQSKGALRQCPGLDFRSYDTFADALRDVSINIKYTFLIFENENSTIGTDVILDTSAYRGITVKRVLESSVLTERAQITHFPGIVVVRPNLEFTPLSRKHPTRESILNAIDIFLTSQYFVFPVHEADSANNGSYIDPEDIHSLSDDSISMSDLEMTIRHSLHVEITRYKNLEGEPLAALIEYLVVLIDYFPFKANGKQYVVNLKDAISRKNHWKGIDISNLVKDLENLNAPVYSSPLRYVACKGSQPNFRGYTCGLWTLFHTLTVNAARKPNGKAPDVLKAMHGYVKHFFGCTDCSVHFQDMAARNRIFDVKENDKAVLWLWISHNEVNLRLAGDVTEDPVYPKVQFPSVERCRECRLARGAWNLPAVYRYLQSVYSAEFIKQGVSRRSPPVDPLSNLDIGLLSLLYIMSFVILIFVVKLFLTKRLYRKRVYKHSEWGKV